MPRKGDLDEENLLGRRLVGRASPEYRQVYFIEAVGRDIVKIGCADDARKRLAQLQVGSPDELVLLGVWFTDDARHLEFNLHEKFDHLRIRGEWFRLDDRLHWVIEATFDPDDGVWLPLCYHPERHEKALVKINYMDDDTPATFSARVAAVAEAVAPRAEC